MLKRKSENGKLKSESNLHCARLTSTLTALRALNLLSLSVQSASKLELRSLNRSFNLSALTALRALETWLHSL